MRAAWTGAVALGLAAAVPAGAQPSVRVEPIATDQQCDLYGAFWGLWLVIECRKSFPEMQGRIGSALAESGRFTVSGPGRAPALVVTGRITSLGATNATAWSSGTDNYCVGGTRVAAALDLRIRDTRTGRIVYAGTITKSVEIAAHVVAGSSQCAAGVPSRVNYGALQREVALAAARAVAFQSDPLRVTSVDGQRVSFNYGAPLLALGMIAQVPGRSGYPAKYRITAATPQTAFAEPMGNPADVAPGAVASVIESDDPAANGRRYDRTDLP